MALSADAQVDGELSFPGATSGRELAAGVFIAGVLVVFVLAMACSGIVAMSTSDDPLLFQIVVSLAILVGALLVLWFGLRWIRSELRTKTEIGDGEIFVRDRSLTEVKVRWDDISDIVWVSAWTGRPTSQIATILRDGTALVLLQRDGGWTHDRRTDNALAAAAELSALRSAAERKGVELAESEPVPWGPDRVDLDSASDLSVEIGTRARRPWWVWGRSVAVTCLVFAAYLVVIHTFWDPSPTAGWFAFVFCAFPAFKRSATAHSPWICASPASLSYGQGATVVERQWSSVDSIRPLRKGSTAEVIASVDGGWVELPVGPPDDWKWWQAFGRSRSQGAARLAYVTEVAGRLESFRRTVQGAGGVSSAATDHR